MSTVKTASLRSFISMFLLLIFFSCNQTTENKSSSTSPEEIIFIGLSNVGGELGNYKNIKITQDSIHLDQGSTLNQKHSEWHKAITPKIWENLTSSFKIKDLSLIESSPSIQHLDGMDETFQIKTTKNSHVYVNSYSDKYYLQFEEFKIKLGNIIPKKYQ
jgi:hypothetical protein